MSFFQRREFIKAIGAGLVFMPILGFSNARAQELNFASAINKSGRQRMLSQRLAKVWLMRLFSINKNHAVEIQKISFSLFETQLNELASFLPSPEMKNTHGILSSEWMVYKKMLELEPDKSQSEQLGRFYAQSNVVLDAANALTKAYEQAASAKSSSMAKTINMAGYQRMLSQRMFKNQLFARAKIQVEETQRKLKEDQDTFLANHKILEGTRENTRLINQNLALVSQQYFLYQKALSSDINADGKSWEYMASASENILKQLNEIVELYEGVSAKA